MPRDNTPVPCACGCGRLLTPFDARGRPRRFISGHNARKYAPDGPRVCTGCGQRLPVAAFFRGQSRCKDCLAALQAAYYARNSARIRARIAARYAADPMPKRTYQRAYAERTGAARRAYNREYTRRNRAKRRAAEQRRYGRLVAGPGFTHEEWQLLCERYGQRCLACGAIGSLEADHVVPLARGGGNTIDNIQPLCGPCNWHKHTATTDYRPRPLLEQQ